MTTGSLQHLIEALDGDPEVVENAEAQLLALGPAAVAALITTMQAGQGRRAWRAAALLGEIHAPEALPALHQAVLSPRPLLGNAAAKALLKYNTPDTPRGLLAALPNCHPMVQQTIIVALQHHPDPTLTPDFMALLPTVESPPLRYGIIQILGQLGDPAAIPLIRSYLNDPDHHVRDWAAHALTQLESGAA